MNTAIHTLIKQWKQAVVAKDIDKIVSFYADDIIAFDAVSALQFKGKAAYRAHWQACMEVCPGPGVFDFHELHIVAADNSAFAHWLAHCGGTGPDGVLKTCWMRVTSVTSVSTANGRWCMSIGRPPSTWPPASRCST